MAVAHVGTGAVASGATSAAAAYPTGLAAGHLLLLTATCKPDTSTFPEITGWILQVDVSVGSGDGGPGNGPQRLGLYTRSADGSETGTVTVTPSGTPNVVQAAISAYSVASGTVFALDIATGSDTSAATNLSATADHIIGETANDRMFWGPVASANSNMGSSTVNATGATYGTSAERVDGGTNTGNDSRLAHGDRPVNSGTATAATVFTSTIAAVVTGGCVFVRMREAPRPVHPTRSFEPVHRASNW